MDSLSEPPVESFDSQDKMFSWKLWQGRPSAGSFGQSSLALDEARLEEKIRLDRLSREQGIGRTRSIGKIAIQRTNKHKP